MRDYSEKVRIVIEMKFPVLGTHHITISKKDMDYVSRNMQDIIDNPYVVCVTVVKMKTYEIVTMKRGPLWNSRDIIED